MRERCSILLAVFFPLITNSFAQGQPAQVKITVNLGGMTRTMRGGIGASWHAIENPIPVEGDTSHGGSAWGANPAPENTRAWHQIYRYADWLGLDFCRVEVEQRMYEPERGEFTWESPEMLVLGRILDWCERRKVDVFFQQMWGNVGWNAYPEWRNDPVRRVHSGPVSLQDYAEGLAALMAYLVNTKHYSCIRWLSISNEPGHDWSWWLKPPNVPMPLTPALAAVRKALDEKGIQVPLSGPDWTDLPAFNREKIDFDPFVGAYDVHSYYAGFDWLPKEGYPLAEAEQRLADWAAWAHSRGKPLFLSELGTMVFGWGGNNPGPGSYESALKDAELVIRGMAAGVDGFNRWSFINRGDLDGQWQLLDTWDIGRKKLMERPLPHPNAFYVFGLLSRFSAKQSGLYGVSVEGGLVDGKRRVHAAAVRSPKGEITLLVLNDAPTAWTAAFGSQGLNRNIVLHKYQVTPEMRDQADVRIKPLARFRLQEGNSGFEDELPGSSITVYSTYKLGHGVAGIITDP